MQRRRGRYTKRIGSQHISIMTDNFGYGAGGISLFYFIFLNTHTGRGNHRTLISADCTEHTPYVDAAAT